MCSQPWELALALGLAEGSPHASLHLKGTRVGLERSKSQEGGVQVSSGLLMPRELDHKLRIGHLSESRNEDQWGGRPEQVGVFMHMYVYTRVHACIYVQCVCAHQEALPMWSSSSCPGSWFCHSSVPDSGPWPSLASITSTKQTHFIHKFSLDLFSMVF